MLLKLSLVEIYSHFLS